jgi:stress-induced morphogen
MSSHPTDFKGSVIDALREAIERQVPDSRAEVSGGGGHFSIEVTSPAFAGKSMVDSQRMVYSAIAHLMKGEWLPSTPSIVSRRERVRQSRRPHHLRFA